MREAQGVWKICGPWKAQKSNKALDFRSAKKFPAREFFPPPAAEGFVPSPSHDCALTLRYTAAAGESLGGGRHAGGQGQECLQHRWVSAAVSLACFDGGGGAVLLAAHHPHRHRRRVARERLHGHSAERIPRRHLLRPLRRHAPGKRLPLHGAVQFEDQGAAEAGQLRHRPSEGQRPQWQSDRDRRGRRVAGHRRGSGHLQRRRLQGVRRQPERHRHPRIWPPTIPTIPKPRHRCAETSTRSRASCRRRSS